MGRVVFEGDVSIELRFLKVALLRENPRQLDDLDTVFDVIQAMGDYPVNLISSHLKRVS